jgi:hypothetical protein
MASKVFILGAGFSASAGFPLVRDLRREVVSWIEKEQHPSAKPHLTPNVHGYPQGQFYAGWDVVDPDRVMGFEEWMIALRDRLPSTYDQDPSYVFHRILREACGRLLWHRHRTLTGIPSAYQNFASWFHEHHQFGQTNAIVSLNWDVLAERVLSNSKVGWSYTTQSSWVPVLKPHGSINWSSHLNEGLRAEFSGWKRIAPESPYSFIPVDPFADPFATGTNQRFRKLLLPGDPEDEVGMKQIWKEAEEAVRERDVVVFIGYFLPQYDTFSTEVLRRGTAGKRIEVYARSRETLQDYRQVFDNVATIAPQPFQECPYAQPFIEVKSGTARGEKDA